MRKILITATAAILQKQTQYVSQEGSKSESRVNYYSTHMKDPTYNLDSVMLIEVKVKI